MKCHLGGIGMVTQSRVYLASLLNATIVGISFLFTKIALEETTPTDTLGFRFLVAWIALTVFLLFSKTKKMKINLKDKKLVFSLLILAIFYPTLFFSFQALGLNYTSSSEAGMIFAFSPALTALFAAFFLKEKINGIQLMFIFLSIFGVVYIFVMNGGSIGGSREHWIGILFLFLSCLSIAGYTVLARFLSIAFSPIQLTYVMVTFGVIFFNSYALVKHEGEISEYFMLAANIKFLGAVVFLGIFATMITAFLSNFILSKLTASKMSIFNNLSTVISMIAGAVILNESIEWFHILGSTMIIIGVIGTNFYKGKSSQITKKLEKEFGR